MASVGEMARQDMLQNDSISGKVGERIDPVYLHQKETLPSIWYQSLGGRTDRSHDGRTGPIVTRIRYGAWENPQNKEELNDLLEEIKDHFAPLSRVMGYDPGLRVYFCEVIPWRDQPHQEQDLFHAELDIRFHHEDTSP